MPGSSDPTEVDYDTDKVDEATLALLNLVMWREDGFARAWKGFDWDSLDRLHAKGFIDNPKGKARSVLVTEAGARKAEELFQTLFGKRDS